MGTSTFSGAEVVLPVPPLAETTVVGPVVYGMAAVTVIFTVSVHERPAAITAPDRLTIPLPDAAAAVPPHVLLRPFGVATNISGGKLSVKATPVNATVFTAGLTTV